MKRGARFVFVGCSCAQSSTEQHLDQVDCTNLYTLTVESSLEPIVAPAKYRKLLGLDFCHDLLSSLCLQKVSLVKSFVSVI